MAIGQQDKRTRKLPELAEDEEPEETELARAEEEAALEKREASGDDEAGDASAEGDPARSLVAAGDTEDAEADDEAAAAQLGTERYVIAAFFATGMLCAFLLGKLIHGLWATVSNKDWFSRTLPAFAAVGDDDKMTYGTVVGGIIALVLVLRTYRNPQVRAWSDDVASELAKVKWPTKKEVTNATLVVITATTVATLYLALLDRFWAFVTNIVYGDGS